MSKKNNQKIVPMFGTSIWSPQVERTYGLNEKCPSCGTVIVEIKDGRGVIQRVVSQTTIPRGSSLYCVACGRSGSDKIEVI